MCRRIQERAWQFPQGGIKANETTDNAMYRELFEEIGVRNTQIIILGQTENWLYYDVPQELIKPKYQGIYKGQKQIWYLLQLLNDSVNINLNASKKPEFDAIKWCDYSNSPNNIIEFKRQVYINALAALKQYL